MAFSCALLSAAFAVGYGAEIHGGVRAAGESAAGYYGGERGGEVAGGCGGALFGSGRMSEFGDEGNFVTTLRGVALRDAQKRRQDRRTPKWIVLVIVAGVLGSAAWGEEPAERWTEKRAAEWYSAQPWLVGSNYIPATAINELEMWQADTFDARRIDLELGWAESIGLNTMRVFLHDLLWEQDAAGFRKRIDTFLQIAAKHHIKPIFVLFDSC